jgi:acyl carrier protein
VWLAKLAERNREMILGWQTGSRKYCRLAIWRPYWIFHALDLIAILPLVRYSYTRRLPDKETAMGVSRKEVEQAVKTLLVQFVGGDGAIKPEDTPISGLGLTSLDGVDFACEIEKKLGCSIPNKLNPFLNDEGSAERSVTQIIDAISTLCASPKESSI